jgi:transglutaminase-like putative cysteine protease
MTATLTPPASPSPESPTPAPAAGRPAPPRPAPRRPAGPWVAEVLLLAVTLVAVAGFGRLFAERAAVVPLVIAAVGAHLVGAIARRLGWGALPTAAVTLAAFVVQASVVLYPHTSAFGIPTPATFEAVGHDLAEAWELFGRVRAPAPRSRGFLLASTLTLWVAVALADWAAFRLRTIAEAVLPAGAVFIFTTLLGRGEGGVLLTVLLIAVVLGFAAAQRAGRSGRDDAWVGGRSRDGTLALGRTGALVAVVVALVAGLVGPRLPTAGDEALVDWRGEDGPDARTTVSPLVDIRSRLVEQSGTTVFVVRADRPSYWRITSLPDFDGQVWASSERFSKADGGLPSEPPDAATEELRQEFTITDLGSIWAPAALTPVDLVESSEELRWNSELATLIVRREVPDIDGATYTVISQVPSFTPEDLDAAQPADLPDDVEAATAVPAGLPPIVSELAQEAVADAGDRPYDQAKALQDWLRAEFAYDTAVVPGHSSSAIADFLNIRRGYCEQFAGTYAAMARTLGLPARVAVGFTHGQRTARGYTVRGRNAHAWPEVWISGAGWVPFEPTPGRGMPGAEQYTDVPAQQAEEDQEPTPTTPASTTAPTPTPGPSQPAPTTLPRGEVVTQPGATTPTSDDGTPAWLIAGLLALLAVVVLLALDVAVIAVVRRRRAVGPGSDHTVAGRVRTAWGHALGALRLVGVAPTPSETAREFARRASGDLGDAGPALVRLAGMVTATTWAPAGVHADPALGGQADALAHTVSHRIHDDAGWRPRLRAAIDPRTLRSP